MDSPPVPTPKAITKMKSLTLAIPLLILILCQLASFVRADGPAIKPLNFNAQQTSSPVRYGGLWDVTSKHGQFMAVVGAKIYEIDLGSRKILNPEIWAAGGVNTGTGGLWVQGILAEPWPILPKLTLYPLLSLGSPAKGSFHVLAGLEIQFNVIKF